MLAAGDSLYDLLRRLHFSTLAASTAELALAVLFIVLGSLVVSRLGSRAARRSVESLVARSTLPGAAVRSIGRARTLAGVAASVVRIVVWSVAALLVLDQLGINLGPLLAGASIVGVALGFGAQSLVRDFLSGFFILAEDQYGVGDVITISDTTGTVEEVNLRRHRPRARRPGRRCRVVGIGVGAPRGARGGGHGPRRHHRAGSGQDRPGGPGAGGPGAAGPDPQPSAHRGSRPRAGAHLGRDMLRPQPLCFERISS